VVNVFGAKQFHPLLQSALIERYYVIFYMTINIGSLAGIILVPIVAQHNITVAYCLPVGLLGLAILVFLSGTPRYVIAKTNGTLCGGKRKKKVYNDAPSPGLANVPMSTIFRIAALTIPFNIAYSQMSTTITVQGTVMKKAFGAIDVATMNSLDAVSVLLFGSLTGSVIYPALANRNIKIPTTWKFALGSVLGSLAIGWVMLVEHWIHSAYDNHEDGEDPRVSVLWLAPCYILIGWGEIFTVSTAYEIVFKVSSPEKKALARCVSFTGNFSSSRISFNTHPSLLYFVCWQYESAINIFSVGGIPNFICIFLYQACQGWFRNSRGDTNIQHLDDYATAHVAKYFTLLLGILLFGIALNLYPGVSKFVAGIEDHAADLLKTPIIGKPRGKKGDGAYADEESPLLRTPKTDLERHQNYLKYGKGPVLYKNPSMRAGPSMARTQSKDKRIKVRDIHKLYGTNNTNKKPLLLPPGSTANKFALQGTRNQEDSGDGFKTLEKTHSFV